MFNRLASVLSVLIVSLIFTAPVFAQPFAYVPNSVSNTVSVIDTATNIVVDTIMVGTTPFAVAVTPDGTRVYVATENSNTVSVIDTATNTVVGLPIAVGTKPSGVAITPDGARAYVTNQISNNVSVINTATNTVVATIPVGFNPFGVAITPDGTRAYVKYRLRCCLCDQYGDQYGSCYYTDG